VSTPENTQDSPSTDDERAQEGGGQQEQRSVRRPTTLLRERGMRYVNRMRNVGWLAGYAAPGDENSFLLQQTNNLEHALRIQIDKKFASITKIAGRPVMAMVHVRGYRDEHGPQVSLHCIQLDKPSILDLPIDTVWVSGFGQGNEASKVLAKLSKSNFTPFNESGEIREEFRKYLTNVNAETKEFELDERAKAFVKAHSMFGDVLAASGGVIDSRLDRGQNYVSVAGFVDSKAYIPANEHRQEYGLIMLRQHESPEENIPVRIKGRMAKTYIQKLTEGTPILVEGSVRRKVIPNDQNEIVSVHTYIETVRVAAAQSEVDIQLPIPAWWSTIRDRLMVRRSERVAAAKAAKPKHEISDDKLTELAGLI
jgi:hypothetical protein